MVSFWLVLLSLAFYSIGAVAKAGKSVELRPQIADLFVMSLLWAAAIYAGINLDLNRWLLVLLWIVLSVLVGVLAIWPRKLSGQENPGSKTPAPVGNVLKRLWQGWKGFSSRLGTFQTRMLLSLCFFLLGSPLILFARLLRDPLHLKSKGSESYWLSRTRPMTGLEHFRKQF